MLIVYTHFPYYWDLIDSPFAHKPYKDLLAEIIHG